MFSFLKKDEYITRLETVLKEKGYNDLANNLIFSAMYKLRSNYSDYSKVRVLVEDKADYLNSFINILYNYLNDIVFLNNFDKKEEYIVENKCLKVFPNETSLLKNIFKIPDSYLNYKADLSFLEKLNEEINVFFKETIYQVREEIFTDFNSVSWKKEAKEDNINFIFVYLLIWLVGSEYFFKTIYSLNVSGIFLKIKEMYGINFYLDLYNFFTLNILIAKLLNNENDNISNFKDYSKDFMKYILSHEEDLKKIPINNNQRKKEIEKFKEKISEIDIVLSSSKLLFKQYEEYKKKNSNTSFKEYRNKLNEKRDELSKKRDKYLNFDINENNILLEEIKILKDNLEKVNNLKEKNKINKKLNINQIISSDDVVLEERDDENFKIYLEDKLIDFLLKVINLKKIILNKNFDIDDKYLNNELRVLRYITKLDLNKGKKIIENKEVFSSLTEMINNILYKLLELKKISKITDKNNLNILIINEILKSNIIDIEDIYFEINEIDNKIVINFYDKDIWQAETTVIKNMNVNILLKKDKKYKLFIK